MIVPRFSFLIIRFYIHISTRIFFGKKTSYDYSILIYPSTLLNGFRLALCCFCEFFSCSVVLLSFRRSLVNKLKSHMICFALCLTACTLSFGNTPSPEQPVRVQVGNKNASFLHHSKKHSHRAKTKQCKAKCLSSDWFSQAYQPTYYIKSTGVDGETLTMNDETVWAIASNSASTVASWAPNSPIVITPSKWYSQYDFYITNALTHESATAKLSQGPFVKYAIFIQQIDWNSGFVYLTNGTRWTFSPSCRIRPWQAGQAVLIGLNTGWASNGYILVNINEDNYLEANYLR